jgi:putative peptidoglycan lipid II flippase
MRIFGKIINGEFKTIQSAAILLAAASLVSKALGVLRDHVLAGVFGAGDTLDAYYAAFRLPDTAFNLLVAGVLSAGFIPIFTEYLLRDEKGKSGSAWRLTSEMVSVLGVMLLILSALLALFAWKIIPIITPGFSGAKLDLTVKLSEIMFISPVIMGISAVMGGVLQGMKRFLVFAAAPLFYNIGIIIGALVFCRYWGPMGLAWGVVLGAALHLIVQFVSVRALGYRLRWLVPKDGGVFRIFKLSAPRVLSMAVSQIDLMAATVIASLLASGAVSIMNLASNLEMVPVSFVGISYAIAAFPALSRHAALENKKDFIASVSSVARQILFFVVPFAALMLLLRAQTVRLVLGSGNFDWNDTIRTTDTLAFFALSIPAQALVPLLARSFYSLKDSATPLLIALVAVGAGIIGNLTLGRIMGVAGLAFSFSISSFIQAMLLWVMLRMKVGTLQESQVVRSLAKITIAVAPMALIVQLVKTWMGGLVGTQTFAAVAIQFSVSAVIGAGIYFGVAALLKCEEASSLMRAIRQRISPRELPVMAADEIVEV